MKLILPEEEIVIEGDILGIEELGRIIKDRVFKKISIIKVTQQKEEMMATREVSEEEVLEDLLTLEVEEE